MARARRAGRERQAARPGARAAVAAAPAQERRQIALPADTHAQRAVDEHLGLDAAVLRDVRDLGKRELPREDDARKAHGGGLLCARKAVHAHLCGGVQAQPGRHALCQGGDSKVLHDEGVDAGLGGRATACCAPDRSSGARTVFSVRYIPDAARAAKRRGPGEACGVKIARRTAGIVAFEAQIHRVRAGAHRRAQHLGGRRRGPGSPGAGRFAFPFISGRPCSPARGAGAPLRAAPRPASVWARAASSR